MARRNSRRNSKKNTSKAVADDDQYGLNEIDDFAAKREKVMLDHSTLGGISDEGSESEDEEEEVMAVSEESSDEEDAGADEEEGLDGERAYRQVFGRKLNTEPQDVESNGMLDNDAAWGSSKNEYYGADDLDDEETAKEIEQEALRQRRKHLEELNMNDYMDEEVDNEWIKSAKEFDTNEFKESTNQKDMITSIKDFLNMDADDKEKHLKMLFPEFLPLCKEYTQLSDVLKILKTQKESEAAYLKIMALSSYLGTLSAYFSILLHELNANEDFSTMKDHPVMESILTSKEIWRQASELPDEVGNADKPDVENGVKSSKEEVSEKHNVIGDVHISEDAEHEGSDEDQEGEKEHEEDEEDSEVDLDDFEEYVKQSRVPKNLTNTSANGDAPDDYMEASMADVDAQEKKARKRTLRFYTSKIDQEENKKIDRFKGDDDIPYKERLYERQQRLLEEARKRGQHDSKGADLDGKDYDSAEDAVSKSVNEDGEKDYFNQVLQKRHFKKQSRLQAHKDAIKASKEGKLAELAENIGDDGKRAINYQILKNKGLTPHRKKENRNARVKKRNRYAKAQKKLKSIRAVYSGGLSGPYEGEKTGIKKNLTKSVKFNN
ncbi:related to Something about silencing protein 10 [Zygosaccharomyces bailii ISA1307]|nr:related to Something about silencing protein 10 [Zygosaccharomyces bailii ISA1307]